MFIDQHRDEFGVEPICAELPIAPSTYYQHVRERADRSLRSKRKRGDESLLIDIQRVWSRSREVYGYRKVWHQMRREGVDAPRCAVARLMREHGMAGATRGTVPTTTIPHADAACPKDLVHRQFRADAPNQLWVADITYVRMVSGFAYVAFVVDVFSRRIIGWRVRDSLHTDLPLDALEQAIHARSTDDGLIHHSDRGSQYLSIRYTDRLAQEGFTASVGSKGDSYDNALAESINALFKAELIHRNRPWKTVIALELATLEWVHWFNNERLLSPLGYLPPAEFEANYYRRQADQEKAA